MTLALGLLNTYAAFALSQQTSDSGEALLDRGIAFKRLNQLDSALFYFEMAKVRFQAEGNLTDQARALMQIGVVMAYAENYDEALEYQHRALDQLIASGDTSKISIFYNNLGASYFHLTDFEPALRYWNKAIAHDYLVGDLAGAIQGELNLASLYFGIDSLEQSLQIIDRILPVLDPDTNHVELYAAYGTIGCVQMEYGDTLASIANMKVSKEYAALVEDMEYLNQATENLVSAYGRFGMYNEAYEELRQHHEISIDRLNDRLIERTTLLESELEKERVENELLAEQKANQQSQFLFVLALAAVAAGGLVIWFRARQKVAIQKVRTAAEIRAREKEKQRITEQLWSEIGKAMAVDGRDESVFGSDKQTLEGAIAAAKFLRSQFFNPFLQVDLQQAMAFAAERYGEQFDTKISLNWSANGALQNLDRKQRGKVYQVFEQVLLDRLEQSRREALCVQVSNTDRQVVIALQGKLHDLQRTELYISAEATADMMRGRIRTQTEGEVITSKISLPLA